MSAAAITSDLTPPSRSGRLLALVRKLWDYGMQFTASLRQQPATSAAGKTHLVRSFGTSIVQVILIRIALGMKRTRFLAERITLSATQIDAGSQPEPELPTRAPRAPSAATQPRAKKPWPEHPPSDEALALIVRLPTVDQIARKVLREPIGKILADICADICRDLGISRGHPLWDELRAAITEFGGSLVERVKTTLHPANPIARIEARLKAEPTAQPEPASTGPPSLVPA
jgi:hypothetical protein